MLFMVIEKFRDRAAIGERFARRGRMLPEGVQYLASWVDGAQDRCFQVMEAPDRTALDAWVDCWKDLVEFEIVPVVTSSEYWSGA